MITHRFRWVIMLIEFHGHIPSKKNSRMAVHRGNRSIVLPSAAYQRWHSKELPTLLNVGSVPAPFAIDHQFWIGGKTIPLDFDLSNAVESIHDILVDAGIIEDDRWRSLASFSCGVAGFIRGEGKTIVTITHIQRSWHQPVSTLKGDIKIEALEQSRSQKAIVEECWDRLLTSDPH